VSPIIEPNNNVIVIGHYRIGTEINGKHLTQHRKAIHYPLPAMFVILAGIVVLATQKGSPHTATDAVIVGSGIKRNLGIASTSHGTPPCLSMTSMYWP